MSFVVLKQLNALKEVGSCGFQDDSARCYNLQNKKSKVT
jgi:hypothetical protein